MARQIEHPNRKLKVFGDARMREVEPGYTELLLHRIGRALPLPRTDEPGKASQRVFIEAQRLANLTGCRLPAIGDDVGAHRSSKLAVPGVDILDRLLAVFSRWKVQVDVWPFTTHLGEKTLEE
jgi:hypothetical protein